MSETLDRLTATILARKGADPTSSYVAKLLAKGVPHIAKKLGEEAVETAIAAAERDRGAVIRESADLLFHLHVLWAAMDVAPAEVMAELDRREGTSGIAEKAARKE
ncbi:phosphoribosyl-ATP diphosphatase [Zavarzinia sp. CC-PAN008]|uniref:phosphoribosyl-ATP diphosphatase n=1 Tax=Zavarzinia sp. CC-PAN008 TaxID=3243332 RepID=UPI003F744EB4